MRWIAWCVFAAALHGADFAPLSGLDRYRPAPDENPLTPRKIALGRRLFGDRRLSRDGSLSCASCHRPSQAFTDGKRVARGVAGARGDRNVPTIVNRAWGSAFFWDGRAGTLEEQALQPILNSKELGMTAEGILSVVGSPAYARDFRAAFGSRATLTLVARALASYVRTVVSGDSPYDRRTLNPAAQRGMKLFFGKAGCSACHAGPNFTDEQFHNTGVAWRTGSPADIGRAAVTGAAQDQGAFKTPTLRDVARTGPYMHDGSFATLAEVVDYYDRGGQKNAGLDAALRPLHLTAEEKAEIVAFLESLTGRIETGR